MAERTFNRVLESVFKIHPTEQATVALLFIYWMFVCGGTLVVGRIISTSLFLSRLPGEYIPYRYVGMAVAVALSALLFSRFATRFRRDLLIIITNAALIVGILVFRLLLNVYPEALWLLFSLFIFFEIMGALVNIQFWIFAGDIFTSREAKRLFAIILAGGVLANVVAGGGVSRAVETLGAPNLMFAVAACLAVGLVCVCFAGRQNRAALVSAVVKPRHLKQAARPPSLIADFQELGRSPHLLSIAAIVAVTAVVTNIADYQFSVTLKQQFEGNEAEMSTFLGHYFFYCGIVQCLIQFFLTGRLLERFGVLAGMCLLPGTMLLGFVSILVKGSLWTVTPTRAADTVLRYTVNDSTVNLLYLPVDPAFRPRANALIAGVIKPVSIGLSGLAFVVLRQQGVGIWSLSFLALAILGIWIYLVFRTHRFYLRSLANTLQRRRLDLDNAPVNVDESAVRVLTTALRHPDERYVLHALELIGSVKKVNWEDHIVPLLAHPSPQVKIGALDYLTRAGRTARAGDIMHLFQDRDAGVRAAAINSFCALGGQRAIKAVAPFLKETGPDIKSATVSGMIRYGGLDGVLMAAGELKLMLVSEEPAMRLAAANVLGAVRVKNFYQPLLALFGDPSLEVQLGAISAAGQMQCKELVPSLIYKLGHRGTSRAAAIALAGYGMDIQSTLAKVLGNTLEDRTVRVHIPRILQLIGEQSSMDLLVENIRDPDETVRTQIFAAMSRLRLEHPERSVPAQRLAETMRWEAHGFFSMLSTIADLGEGEKGTLLDDALRNQLQDTLDRVLYLIQVLYPRQNVESIRQGLRAGKNTVRDNAIELLDELLDGEVKKYILPMIENISLEQRVRNGRALFGLTSADRDQRLAELAETSEEWVRACAIFRIGELRLHNHRPLVKKALASRRPLVRETAIVALGRMARDSEWQELLGGLSVSEREPHIQKLLAEMLAKAAT